MKKMILTLTESQYSNITQSDDRALEHLVYSFGGYCELEKSTEFIIRDQRRFQTAEYQHRSAFSVVIDHDKVWEVWSTLSLGYSCFLSSHTHVCEGFFSSTDHQQDNRVKSNILDFCRFFVRLVSGVDGIVAEVCSRNDPSWRTLDGIKVVGPNGISYITPLNAKSRFGGRRIDRAQHDRTLRLGPGARNALISLANSSIGMLAAGGGNSIVACLLKFFSPKKIILVDADVLESHNANRFFAYRKGAEGKSKVHLVGQQIRRSHPHIEVVEVLAHFPDSKSITALKEADFLVSFPDKDTVRYDVALFAARYHKPLFDAGTLVSYADGDDPSQITSRILTQLPGGPCLACLGVLGGYSADIEDGVQRVQASYSNRPDVGPAPQIVTSNSFAATLIVRNILAWVYPGLVEKIPTYLQFNELVPSIEDLSGLFAPREDCPICGNHFEAERGWGDRSPSWECFPRPEKKAEEFFKSDCLENPDVEGIELQSLDFERS